MVHTPVRVVEKLLLTFFRSELLQITGVTVGIHISGTLSNLFSERHELTEKTAHCHYLKCY